VPISLRSAFAVVYVAVVYSVLLIIVAFARCPIALLCSLFVNPSLPASHYSGFQCLDDFAAPFHTEYIEHQPPSTARPDTRGPLYRKRLYIEQRSIMSAKRH
jgi:hypothetical protein